MDKLRMESLDLTAQNIDRIAALFPNCITEMLDEEHSTPEKKVYKRAVNFELLKQMLSPDVVDGDEAYEFTWVGKKAAIVEANKPIRKTLRPCVAESKDWDNTENLYIEGDNLEVLKLLQESYLGKVKMIYIDPPYNTGHDFVYPDSYIMDNDEYNTGTKYFDKDGNVNYKRENSDSAGKYHSDWCSMIYSRLLLARNLLTEDGVIFISIDDNEQENLKKICDEVFGEKNFIGCFLWKKKSTSTNVANALVSAQTDYQLCYGKNISPTSLNRRATTTEERKYPYNDNNGNYRTTVIEKKDSGDYARTTMKYPILGVLPREGKRWQIGEKTARDYEARNLFVIENGVVKLKIYEKDDKTTFSANPTLLLDCGSTDSAAKETNVNLFNQAELFSNPKPTNLLLHFAKMATQHDSIVLDFFSGSATTAHAVMQLNAEDGGHRKFIMVQLPEPCDEASEAYKAGYKNICEIGKERIRRAGEKIIQEQAHLTNAVLSGAFPRGELHGEFTTSAPAVATQNEVRKTLDVGFRVLKLDDTNMKDVYYAPDDYDQGMLAGLESNIKDDRTDLDLLFGCLIDWGLPLSLPYKSEQIDGCTVHTYNDGDLIACFDTNIPESVVKEIAQRRPLRAVFRDSGFASSPEKINVFEIFKLYMPEDAGDISKRVRVI